MGHISGSFFSILLLIYDLLTINWILLFYSYLFISFHFLFSEQFMISLTSFQNILFSILGAHLGICIFGISMFPVIILDTSGLYLFISIRNNSWYSNFISKETSYGICIQSLYRNLPIRVWIQLLVIIFLQFISSVYLFQQIRLLYYSQVRWCVWRFIGLEGIRLCSHSCAWMILVSCFGVRLLMFWFGVYVSRVQRYVVF